MEIIEILYIVLIFFTVIIGSLISILLYKLLKIISVITEIIEVYNEIKQIISFYNQIPKVFFESIKKIFKK
ncbi:hypothetical protein H3C61_01125 [Candidatus Gracilibacteria bacterium]|nr:hypothetical protein [Candidatus Gracilibacteria bacterium]